MRRISYKILLLLLRCLMYAKRLLVFVFNLLKRLFVIGSSVYRNTIGLYAYKTALSFKNAIGITNAPVSSFLADQLSRRFVLQFAMLLIMVFSMVPESKLFTQDETKIPGHDTLLYKIIGPGDQDFSLEEITLNVGENTVRDSRSWKEGAAEAVQGRPSDGLPRISEEGIAGTSVGGAAFVKPTILQGVQLPGSVSSLRGEIVFHNVEQGEVVGAIAERYGISVATILWANNLTVRSYIRPGDKLKIPPVTGVVHIVKKGDTVAKIAKTYKAKEEEIIAFNKLQENGTDIVIGEEIIVPNGVKQQQAPTRATPAFRYGALVNIAAPPASPDSPLGSGYIWPVGVRRMTQYFGWRHTGVDIAGPIGVPIYAARAGVVTRSNCAWNGGYGCYIVIDHGGGVNTAYGHSSQLYVTVGEEVYQGQTIAVVGSTGRSTGPHLHFEVRISGKRVNPLKYIR